MKGYLVKFAWMLLLPLAALAEEACRQAVCWSVTPVVCIANDSRGRCQGDLTVHWSSPDAVVLCLFLAEESLTCWPTQQQGSWQAPLSWPDEATLTLRAADQVLLEEELKTVRRTPYRRRRLVAPWSVL